MAIKGVEGRTVNQVLAEVDRGARFVRFEYCVSVLVMTFKRSSPIFYLRPGEGAGSKHWPYTLVALVAGWWGIPWGPIWTIGAIGRNLKGGHDVTMGVVTAIRPNAYAPASQAAPSGLSSNPAPGS